MMDEVPSIQIRHSPAPGKTWSVRATWKDGRFEEMSGFQSEAEASEWITDKFQIWLDEINKARTAS